MADVDLHPSLPVESTLTMDDVDIQHKDQENKRPKRVLHFSDGVLEEYSSDDSEDDVSPVITRIDPRMLTWTPWCMYYLSLVARKSFTAAELCGEKLAWFFGITAPKYGYALEEYKRMEREIELEQERDQKLYAESQGLSTIEIEVRGGKKATVTQLSELGHGDTRNETEKY